MALDFFTGVILFVVFSAIATFFIKKFTKLETYYLITLGKTTKPLPFFSHMARHKKIAEIDESTRTANHV